MDIDHATRFSSAPAVKSKHKEELVKATLSKFLLDDSNKYPIEIIVAWAVSAKNALHNCYG